MNLDLLLMINYYGGIVLAFAAAVIVICINY